MVTIRIPLAQYSYIEYEFDGTPFQAIAEHNNLVRFYQECLKTPHVEANSGLSVKDWNQALDSYLMTQRLTEEQITGMSDKQRGLINEIKKSLSRIKAKDDTGMRADSKNYQQTITRD